MLTAAAPVPVLTGALMRSGWHDLSGKQWHGLRAILLAVAQSVEPRSGSGYATANQIADKAGGYSTRWTRHLLHELEALGVITWWRGGIVSGKPEPSWFRINKKTLLALIKGGRVRLDEVLAKRRERTQARINGLRKITVKPRRSQRPGKAIPAQAVNPAVHAELNASLPPNGEVPPPAGDRQPLPKCVICGQTPAGHARRARQTPHDWTTA